MPSNAHSTGTAGTRSNVYRLGNAPAVLRSRKPRNRFRTWIQKFCALPPDSRLRVMKVLLAEFQDEVPDEPDLSRRSSSSAALLLEGGISRDLWERFGQAQVEAWRTERPEHRGQAAVALDNWETLL